ncbi:3-oxoacyl-[acyl-carrier-protein] synthase 3 [compost metagenome]
MSTGLAQSWQSQGELSVLGTGSAFPGSLVPTETLVRQAGLSGRQRTLALSVAERMGVRTRHISRAWTGRIDTQAERASNPVLAARAVDAALRDAGLQVADLGYLIAHTATPAQPLPSNAAFVADILGYAGPHVELRQACTGFANALMIAFGLLAQPGARPVAIVGSETGSVFLDLERLEGHSGQIVNLVQMGDGAGAVILGPAGTNADTIHAAWFGALGLHRPPGLQMCEGGSERSGTGHAGPLTFEHDFASVLRGGAELFDAGVEAASARGFEVAQADWIIPHQASGRIGRQLAGYLDVPEERFLVNADRVGNTGSAAIWTALAELRARRPASGTLTIALGAEATKYMFGGFVHEAG